MLLLISCVTLHDIQYRIVPQDFVGHIYTQVQASIGVLDGS